MMQCGGAGRGGGGTRQVRREGPAACGCAGGRPSLGVAMKTSLFCTVTARVRAPGGGRAGPGWRDAVKGEPTGHSCNVPLSLRPATPPPPMLWLLVCSWRAQAENNVENLRPGFYL